jgi:F0F1-type ATP synthase assembly protein I
MYFLLQSLIVFAVMASNIAWHWTPNSYLAGVIGFIAALLATVGLSNLLLWARKQRGD